MLTAAAVSLSIESVNQGYSADPPRGPNLVFILADDLGYSDTTLYGTTRFYETPNIQRLASRGMLLTQAYAANPLCSPTRASIMTGLYPSRIGITAPVCHVPEERLKPALSRIAPPFWPSLNEISATRLSRDYRTIADSLRDAGYVTGHFGKWHLGPEPYSPLQHGFDSDIPHWWGPGPAGSYIAPWAFPPKLKFTGKPGEHIEDRMAQEAIKFLKTNKDRPFFLNYWAFSVHQPWDGKRDLVAKYAAKADPKSPQRHPVYGAMVQSLDENVGKLLDAIDELKLADHTIIVFFSDNGGVTWVANNPEFGRGLPNPPGTPITSNAPLRGGKATMYEGGTREPCVVVWPGVIRAGSRSDQLVSSVDFFPTLLDMLHLSPRPGQSFDGVSFAPALRGGTSQRDSVFCFFPHYSPKTGAKPSAYLRQGDWKLIRYFFDGPKQTDRYELFDLKNDLGETTNAAADHPEIVKKLDALLTADLQNTHALLPQPNPRFDPAARPPHPQQGAAAAIPEGSAAAGVDIADVP